MTISSLFHQVDSVTVSRSQASIGDAIAQYNTLYQELDDQDEKTSDRRKIELFRERLKTVDPSFESFYNAFILQKEDDEKTWDKFCAGVRTNAASLAQTTTYSGFSKRAKEQAFLADTHGRHNNGDGRFKRGDFNKNKKTKGECWNCGKPGHNAYDCRGTCRKPDCAGKGKHKRQQCRSKGRDKRVTREPSSTSEQANFAEEAIDEGGWYAEEDVSAFVSLPTGSHRNKLTTGTPLRIIDSGCGSHILSGSEKLFDKKQGSNRIFNTAGKTKLMTNEHANTKFYLKNGKGKHILRKVSGVVAKDLPVSLLSVSQLDRKQGYYTIFGGGEVYIIAKKPSFDKGDIIGTGQLTTSGVYALHASTNGDHDGEDTAMFTHKQPTKNPKQINAVVLHGRLGHAGLKAMNSFCKKHNFALTETEDLKTCLACRLGRAKDRSYSKNGHYERSDVPGDYWHIDLIGPFRTATLGGRRFALICTDDASGYRFVYLLTTKGDQFDAFKTLYVWVETQLGTKIKRVRCDGDWTTTAWNQFKGDKGIEQYQTTTNHPRSNGTAERANGIVTEMARCLLIAANLPPTFFGETLMAAVYVLNRCHSARSGPEKTPLEWIRKKSVFNTELRAYGSHAWVTRTDSPGKAGTRAREGILIGYDEQRRAYRVYCPENKKILVSDAVVFDEQRIGLRAPRRQVNNISFNDLFGEVDPATDPIDIYPTSTTVPSAPNDGDVQPLNAADPAVDPATSPISVINNSEVKAEQETDSDVSNVNGDVDVSDDATNDLPDDINDDEPTSDVEEPVRRSGRSMKPTPAILEYIADQPSALLTESVSISEKKAWTQEEWKNAMQIELDGLRDLGTFKVVPRPTGRSVIGGRWVLAKKTGSDGSTKYKARYVCKGYSQIHGIDFNETWSPTLRGQSIRLLVALSAADGSKLRHLDVKNAFVNAPLEEELYVEIPYGAPGYGSDCVWKLQKALYGLKQAGREWNKMLATGLRKLDFKQTVSDPCLFVGQGEFARIIVGVYVDDCIVKYHEDNKMRRLLSKLQKEFPIKDEGELKSFVGVEVTHTKEYIKLHQSSYLLSVLKRFKYDDSDPVTTPGTKSPTPSKKDTSNSLSKFGMRAIVGTLLYLSMLTRPDITYAVARLAQTVSEPGPSDYQAAARILRYLNGTRSLGVCYFKNKGKPILSVYVDSSWGDYPNGRSHGGHVIFYGGPVDWSSRKQGAVCLSSSEAELIAAVDAGKNVLWYRSLLGELGIHQKKPTVLFEDNSGAIVLAHTTVIGKRTRHVNIKYHCINDWVSSGALILQKIATTKNVADIFTKPLEKTLFQRFASKLVL